LARDLFPIRVFTLLPGMFRWRPARIQEGCERKTPILVPQVGVTHDPKGQATALVVGADNKGRSAPA